MRRRIRREFSWSGSWAQTAEVRYIYDGMLVIQERDVNNLPTVKYTRGRDLSGSLQGAGGIGGLLARTDAANSQSAWYHADGNGNVTAMLNAQQIVMAKYTYDPFGNTSLQIGAARGCEHLPVQLEGLPLEFWFVLLRLQILQPKHRKVAQSRSN